jgi:hypothetical protein
MCTCEKRASGEFELLLNEALLSAVVNIKPMSFASSAADNKSKSSAAAVPLPTRKGKQKKKQQDSSTSSSDPTTSYLLEQTKVAATELMSSALTDIARARSMLRSLVNAMVTPSAMLRGIYELTNENGDNSTNELGGISSLSKALS